MNAANKVHLRTSGHRGAPQCSVVCAWSTTGWGPDEQGTGPGQTVWESSERPDMPATHLKLQQRIRYETLLALLKQQLLKAQNGGVGCWRCIQLRDTQQPLRCGGAHGGGHRWILRAERLS